MKRVLILAVAVVLLAPAAAPAKDRTCKINDYELIKTENVKCKRAKKVVRRYFKQSTRLYGFTCSQKQYPGGVTTTCTKGESKRITHYSAD